MCLKKKYDYHMIGAGDCIFESTYAEKIIKKMEENPKLVICSGDFGKQKSKTPHGAGRFVKQSYFFSNYNEYPEIIGYESEIILKTIIQNFKVEIFHDIRFDHVDQLGHSHNFFRVWARNESIRISPSLCNIKMFSSIFWNWRYKSNRCVEYVFGNTLLIIQINQDIILNFQRKLEMR